MKSEGCCAAAVQQLASVTRLAGKGDWLGRADNQLMWEGLDFLGLLFPPFFITRIVFFFLFSTKETLQDWAGNECMALSSHHDVFSLKKETKVGFISDAEQQTPQCFDSQRLSPQGQVT